MFESRYMYFKKKPILVLDNKFKFINDLNVGEKGQLKMVVKIHYLELQQDMDGNEKLVFDLNVLEAKKLEPEKLRA